MEVSKPTIHIQVISYLIMQLECVIGYFFWCTFLMHDLNLNEVCMSPTGDFAILQYIGHTRYIKCHPTADHIYIWLEL